MPWNHSSSVSCTSRANACICLTRLVIISCKRGFGALANRRTTSSVMLCSFKFCISPPLSEVDAPRVPEVPLHNSSDRLKYFAHMPSRHLLVSKFLFSVYKFVRVFNKESFTPLRGEQILWDRTHFSNEPMLRASVQKV